MRTVTLLTLFSCLIVAPVHAQTDDAPARILGAALADDRAYQRLAELTDGIGARLSGSKNLERAVAWGVAGFEADGMDRVWTEELQVPHWVRGEERARIVAPAEHPVVLSTLGGSIATPPDGIEAAVVEVGSFEELEALGDTVAGKIVLFNKTMIRNGGSMHGYGSAAGLRVLGAARAARQGAVASLVRSLGTADYRLPHTGAMRYEEGTPKIPAAAITAEDADLIQRMLARGEEVRMHLVLTPKMLPDATSHNVLADLRGREKPDEIVLLACHLDSWDVGTGAIDDGAGCVAVMETMRILKELGLRPRRTIRGVLFTNEENGLGGGKDYAKRYAAEMPNHVAAMESDSGAGTPTGFGVSAGPGAVEIVDDIAAALAHIGATEVRNRGGGADISPMKPAGVPQMNLRQDTTYYFDYHHTEADTLDKVDPGDLARNVAAMAVMAYGLAEHEEVLPRPEPPEPKEGN